MNQKHDPRDMRFGALVRATRDDDRPRIWQRTRDNPGGNATKAFYDRAWKSDDGQTAHWDALDVIDVYTTGVETGGAEPEGRRVVIDTPDGVYIREDGVYSRVCGLCPSLTWADIPKPATVLYQGK